MRQEAATKRVVSFILIFFEWRKIFIGVLKEESLAKLKEEVTPFLTTKTSEVEPKSSKQWAGKNHVIALIENKLKVEDPQQYQKYQLRGGTSTSTCRTTGSGILEVQEREGGENIFLKLLAKEESPNLAAGFHALNGRLHYHEVL